jgi:exonuclease VII small subunit
LEALGARLESGDLDADEATALLEQLTGLVHEAVDVLEHAGESLESDEGPTSSE